jgi:FkbM family methyltransferase
LALEAEQSRSRRTSLLRAAQYGYWVFLRRPHYTTFPSRLRLAAWLLTKGRFSENVRVRLVPHGVDVWLRPGVIDMVTLAQVWGWRQYDLPIAPPATIIDAGANIGLSTLFFALRWPESSIVAVEPEQENFALLERNLRSIRNVHAVCAALWKSSDSLVLLNPDAPPNNYRVQSGPGDVRGTTVPELCQAEGWDRIGLLKLDIEGAELEVLRSSSTWIDRVDVLVVELHDGLAAGCSEAFHDATTRFEHHSTEGELDIAWH